MAGKMPSHLTDGLREKPVALGGVKTRRAAAAWAERPINCPSCGAPHKRGADCIHCGRERDDG